jgi:hypothetical protein
MHDLLVLLIGVVLGGAMNLTVQLMLGCIQRRRELRLAARVLYDELMEIGSIEINTCSGKFDPANVHAAWREHRAALVNLGGETWSAVEEGVMWAVYPQQFEGLGPPQSHNARLERALYLLEPRAALPRSLRGFE